MSCDRRCFDPESIFYEHDECHTCPGSDSGPRKEQSGSIVFRHFDSNEEEEVPVKTTQA